MSEREAPLVALVCSVPLLAEALCDALVGLAECKVISAGEPDLPGLLRSLQPDAIVVDDEYEAESAASYSRFARIPVVQVSLRSHQLRVLEDGRWQELDHVEATSETVRNLVAGEIYGRRAAR
jgi:hypothetical protein